MALQYDKLAGKLTWVNDALVEFDAAGICLGIIQFAKQEPLQAIVPLRDIDIAVFASLGAIVTGGDDDVSDSDGPRETSLDRSDVAPGKQSTRPGRKSTHRNN